MKARELFERAAAPTEAPPKPGTTPAAPPKERPGRPAPGKHPNPFRRRRHGTEPGPMPKPKACVEAKAKEAFNALKTDPAHWRNPRKIDCPGCGRKGGHWCKNTNTGKSMPNKTHQSRITASRKMQESAKSIILRTR